MNIKIYKGFTNLPEIGTIITTRKNRTPKHLSIEKHNEVDKYFDEKFGIKFRSQSVFCTGDIKTASEYGKVAIIEPIGEFEVCWSPICFDLIEIEDFTWMTTEEFILENKYQIGNIQSALESGNEIMLFCEKYKVISYE